MRSSRRKRRTMMATAMAVTVMMIMATVATGTEPGLPPWTGAPRPAGHTTHPAHKRKPRPFPGARFLFARVSGARRVGRC